MVPLGSADEPLYQFDTERRKWVMKVFPSLFPSGAWCCSPHTMHWLCHRSMPTHAFTTSRMHYHAIAGRRDVALLERWLDENALENFEPLQKMEAISLRETAATDPARPASSLTARHSEMMKLSRETQEHVERSAELLKKVCVGWRGGVTVSSVLVLCSVARMLASASSPAVVASAGASSVLCGVP